VSDHIGAVRHLIVCQIPVFHCSVLLFPPVLCSPSFSTCKYQSPVYSPDSSTRVPHRWKHIIRNIHILLKLFI